MLFQVIQLYHAKMTKSIRLAPYRGHRICNPRTRRHFSVTIHLGHYVYKSNGHLSLTADFQNMWN